MKSIAVPVTRRSAQRTRQPAPARPVRTPGAEGVAVQPTAAQSPSSQHRYGIGQRLSMTAGSREFSRVASSCVVVALLPHERGPFRYRVQSDAEGFERIVDELDLSPADQMP